MQRLTPARAVARLGALAAAAAASVACGTSASPHADAGPSELGAYLNDAGARRSALEASLVNPANGYSALRLAHYATAADGDWDRLPEWNPVVEPVSTAELGAAFDGGVPVAASAAALALPDDPVHTDESELLALGKLAFERYPIQLAPYFDGALATRDAASGYGLWLDDARGVGGLVRAQLADGTTSLALTCSSCHAAAGALGIENGLPNSALNLGAALVDSGQAALGSASLTALAAWGPGRLDVTTATGVEPVRIPDLRSIAFQTHLQQDATLVVVDRTTLAIRIETLAITSSGQVLRPPRVVAWALARYLETLAATLPDEGSARADSPRGAEIFGDECATCHRPPSLPARPCRSRSWVPTRRSVCRRIAARARTAFRRSTASARAARSCTTRASLRSATSSTRRASTPISSAGCTAAGRSRGTPSASSSRSTLARRSSLTSTPSSSV